VIAMPVRTSLQAPPGAASAAKGLAGIDALQLGTLEQLRHGDGPHNAMLSTLIVTNCLLELAKLASMRLTLSDFTQSAVACLTQFVPLERCVMSIAPDGLPALRTETGSWDDVPVDLLDGTRFDELAPFGVVGTVLALPGTDRPLGFVAMGGLPDHLASAGLVERSADQVSSVLGVLIEAEQMRRQAAANKVVEVLANIGDSYDETTIDELGSLLQSLPGAVGSRILLEVPRFGGPIESRAGQQPDNVPTTERVAELDRSGRITTTLWWGDETAATPVVDDLLERLASTVERVEHTARLVAETETDDLTGIGNRRRASRALAQSIARAERSGEDVAVLLMDLDHFKKVNDTHGHDVGDKVLRAFAQLLDTVVRGYDVAARWGGEEFLIVCPATDVDGAQALAARILPAVTPTCSDAAGVPAQTVSIGIAATVGGGAGPMELVRAADEALYKAKSGGRNRFIVAPSGVRR
jgi:diguanylate cyclase (GGDEF)-like protein